MKKGIKLTALGSGLLLTSSLIAGLAVAGPNHAEVTQSVTGSRPQQVQAAATETGQISQDQAVAIALSAVPGTVLSAELEEEDGVLVYGVDIKASDGTSADIKVEASSGKVLKIDRDNDGETNDDSVNNDDNGNDGETNDDGVAPDNDGETNDD